MKEPAHDYQIVPNQQDILVLNVLSAVKKDQIKGKSNKTLKSKHRTQLPQKKDNNKTTTTTTMQNSMIEMQTTTSSTTTTTKTTTVTTTISTTTTFHQLQLCKISNCF